MEESLAIKEKVKVGGIPTARSSCHKCYGKGVIGFFVETDKQGKWKRTNRPCICSCMRFYPNKKLIPKDRVNLYAKEGKA